MNPSLEEIRNAVSHINWFHQIDLGNGIVTPGCDGSQEKLSHLGVPTDLTGKSVLDIGAWDGFFSFEAERRNAARVLAVDSFTWKGQGWGSKKGFDLARSVLRSRVESRVIDVYDIKAEDIGTYDVVLFLGVLYHLKHPLLALERVFEVTNELLILETHVDLPSIKRPAIAFYPEAELNNDGSNWCGPNPSAVLAMLKTVGFVRSEVYWQSAFEPNVPPNQVTSTRAIFHAWH